jgi:hypothetical protein
MTTTPFKIMSMSGGAVFGMTNGRVIQFARRTPCHSQQPESMCPKSTSAVGTVSETDIPSNEKIRKGKANMNQAVRGLEGLTMKKKPKRKPIDF